MHQSKFGQTLSLIEETIKTTDPKEFLDTVIEYQTVPVGGYAPRAYLAELYSSLSDGHKKKISPPAWKLKNAFRGDDGVSSDPAISFTFHKDPEVAKRNAKFYGRYTFPLSDFSYEGVIDTTKLRGAGDDESELIIINPRYLKGN